jgi:hypothetical protein
MAIEAVGGFFYLYVSWQGPKEDFLQFCFLKNVFLGEINPTVSSQKTVEDSDIISVLVILQTRTFQTKQKPSSLSCLWPEIF